jgi:inosine-uridine nucleoside N-ribohydrolase
LREKIERFAVLIQFVKFKSALSTEDVQKVIHERSPRYEALPGLLEKYYGVQHETGEVYGVYTWDSVAAAFARNWSTRSQREGAAGKIPPVERVGGSKCTRE